MVTHVPVDAYVISLASRADRRDRLPQLVDRLGGGASVLDAVEGAFARPPDSWVASPHAWACKESHLRALRLAAPDRPVLIVEDDADVPPDFLGLLRDLLGRLPGDWEAVMLGGEHRTAWPLEQVSPGVVRCYRTCRTHCYLVRGTGIAVARNSAAQARTHWDGLLATQLGRRRRAYAPYPFLVGTTGSPSSIPDSRPPSVGRVNLG